MFERWSTLDHEICSPHMPQPFQVLCIRIRDSILPGAERVSKVLFFFVNQFLPLWKNVGEKMWRFFSYFLLSLVERKEININWICVVVVVVCV